MLRLLASLGLMAATVFAMDRVLAPEIGATLLASNDRFMAIYRPETAADVVVVGNSRADNHFPPSILRRTTCGEPLNIGMGGAPTTVNALLWQDYLERHAAPRLLIVEPTSLVDPPTDLADVPLLAHYSPRVDDFLRRTHGDLWTSQRLFTLLAFNNNQTLRMLVGRVRPAPEDRTLDGAIGPEQRAHVARLPEESMPDLPANWEALDTMVRTARDHGTRVAVMVTPYLPAYAAKVGNFDAFFAELKRRLPADVAFIDARRALTSDEHFADPLHMNDAGVRALFAALEPELRQLGTCPIDAVAHLDAPGATAR